MLDEDVFVVKNLNQFRHFELSLGWPRGQNMGTQVVVAHKQARLLPRWLNLYQQYRPAMWYYNAGEYPTQRWEKIIFQTTNLSTQHSVQRAMAGASGRDRVWCGESRGGVVQ